MGKRARNRDRSRVVRHEDGSRTVELTQRESRELTEGFARAAEAFEEKFGRAPGLDDPVFFDPDADEPRPMSPSQQAELEHQTVKALRHVGVSEAYIYALKKTGIMLTEDNEHLFTAAELEEFHSAMDEFEED